MIFMFGKEKKPKRFRVAIEESMGLGAVRVIIDTETGVNYLNTLGEGNSGLTPLLDENGKVVITPADDDPDAE